MAALNGSNRGATRTADFRGGGGTTESNAWCTVRRCTPCLSANARIESPPTR